MKLIKISAIWCPSCLIMEKIWQDLQEEFNDIEFISYDYDLDDEVESYNSGDVLPVLILMEHNKELVRFIGEKSKEELIEGIRQYEK